MQYKILKRQTLAFVDSGYCFNQNIDLDYMLDNNSIIKITRATNGFIGDFIALIETSGAVVFGCITAVDNTALTISFTDAKSCLYDNIYNPAVIKYIKNKEFVGKFDAVEDTKLLIKSNWVDIQDDYKKLPLKFETSGKTTSIWEYKDITINFKDYIQSIFKNDNVVLQFYVDFTIQNNPYLVCKIVKNMNTGILIKDNVSLMTINYTAEQMPEKSVCVIIDSATKEIAKVDDNGSLVNAIYYLRDDDMVTLNSDLEYVYNGKTYYRILPVKTVVVEYDKNNTDGVTIPETAYKELQTQNANHTIEITIDKKSKILNYKDLQIGDKVKIINKNGQIDSYYTGYRDKGGGSVVMTFGKLRKRYTDKIQLILRGLKQ